MQCNCKRNEYGGTLGGIVLFAMVVTILSTTWGVAYQALNKLERMERSGVVASAFNRTTKPVFKGNRKVAKK